MFPLTVTFSFGLGVGRLNARFLQFSSGMWFLHYLTAFPTALLLRQARLIRSIAFRLWLYSTVYFPSLLPWRRCRRFRCPWLLDCRAPIKPSGGCLARDFVGHALSRSRGIRFDPFHRRLGVRKYREVPSCLMSRG